MHLRLDFNTVVNLADNVSEYKIFTWLKNERIWRTISLGFVAKGTNEKSALAPFMHQTITRNNADLLSVRPFNSQWNFIRNSKPSSTSRTLVELWFPMTKDNSSQQDYEQFTNDGLVLLWRFRDTPQKLWLLLSHFLGWESRFKIQDSNR